MCGSRNRFHLLIARSPHDGNGRSVCCQLAKVIILVVAQALIFNVVDAVGWAVVVDITQAVGSVKSSIAGDGLDAVVIVSQLVQVECRSGRSLPVQRFDIAALIVGVGRSIVRRCRRVAPVQVAANVC